MVGVGKKKIEMRRIVDKPKRKVTFSKRRKGLFKKASELDILCGSDTAIISVSEAGTIFTAGRPSFVHGLLLGGASVGGRAGGGGVEFDGGRLDCMGWEELATELAALKKAQLKIELLMMEMEMERNNNNNNNTNAAVSDFTGNPIAAFSSAFVDAAAAPSLPAFTDPLLSEPERETSGCSGRGVCVDEYGFLVVQ